MRFSQSLLLHFLSCCALIFQIGCASAPQKPSSGGLKIIDAHVHTHFGGGKERTSGIELSRDSLLREMREAGVVGGIAHTDGKGGEYTDLRSQNIKHCAGVEATVDARRIEKGLKSGQYGCIKIYLGYVHQYAYDPNYEPAYRLAEKYDVPVVFHTGDTYSSQGKLKYADPLTIDEVAVDHPKVRFVIAHLGNPWIQSAAEVAYKNPNVYLDGSALLIGDLSQLPKEKVKAYVIDPLAWVFGYVEDPSKLMFGTDWPLTRIAPYVEAFKEAIPEEHWNAVFHDNAVRIFKLNPSSTTER